MMTLTILMVILYAAAACAAAYLLLAFLMRPCMKRGDRAQGFAGRSFAHRGLWDTEEGIPENSLPAFEAAVRSGYGVELDVQLTSDGAPVVFHDRNLRRVCGVDAEVSDCSFHDTRVLRLSGTDEPIPTFRSALNVIDSDAPLIVELKGGGDWRLLTDISCCMLEDYARKAKADGKASEGEHGFMVESFDPRILRRVKRKFPDILRGQLSTDYFHDSGELDARGIRACFLTNLLCDFLSRPDFIAYSLREKDQWGFRLCRRLFRPCTAAWTVRSMEDLDAAQEFDIAIFEKRKDTDA